jgi:hypothetical protein
VQAKVLARRGETLEAERLARAAVSVLGEADAPLMRVDALTDLGEVLGDRTPEARAALDEALALCQIKQMAVPTARVEALLAALEQKAEPVPPTALTGP